jgi:hypothetical protein
MFSLNSIEDVAIEQHRDHLRQAEKAQLIKEALKNKAQGQSIAGLFAALSIKLNLPNSVDRKTVSETRC